MQRRLHLGGGDVEAAGDDELLGPVDDRGESVGVHGHDVAGAHPAVGQEGLRRLARVAASSPGTPAGPGSASSPDSPRAGRRWCRPGRPPVRRCSGTARRPCRGAARVRSGYPARPATTRSCRSPRPAGRRSPPPTATTVSTGRFIAPEMRIARSSGRVAVLRRPASCARRSAAPRRKVAGDFFMASTTSFGSNLGNSTSSRLLADPVGEVQRHAEGVEHRQDRVEDLLAVLGRPASRPRPAGRWQCRLQWVSIAPSAAGGSAGVLDRGEVVQDGTRMLRIEPSVASRSSFHGVVPCAPGVAVSCLAATARLLHRQAQGEPVADGQRLGEVDETTWSIFDVGREPVRRQSRPCPRR